MPRTAQTTWHDPHDIIRQVRVGTLTRRNLLRVFGVSAASLGLVSVTGACGAPLRYDYVIVGAGSAGCTLAARLLADSRASVLLIEAGGSNDRPDVRDFTKARTLTAPGSTIDWAFESEPQSALLGRPQSFACGKIEGGSATPCRAPPWTRPSTSAIRSTPTTTAQARFGVAYTQLTVVNGIRQDAFTAFLTPYLTDPRLTIMTEARVTRLMFDREVILCAGTINTAHLLQLSGIGAAGDLEPHGITIVTDLPGVGANLHDHLMGSYRPVADAAGWYASAAGG